MCLHDVAAKFSIDTRCSYKRRYGDIWIWDQEIFLSSQTVEKVLSANSDNNHNDWLRKNWQIYYVTLLSSFLILLLLQLLLILVVVLLVLVEALELLVLLILIRLTYAFLILEFTHFCQLFGPTRTLHCVLNYTVKQALQRKLTDSDKGLLQWQSW